MNVKCFKWRKNFKGSNASFGEIWLNTSEHQKNMNDQDFHVATTHIQTTDGEDW